MNDRYRATPELPDFLAAELPFRRCALEIQGRLMHFVDEGQGRPVLLVHGNPTWSFLWRKVIGALRGTELRLVAPDLFGFGLSEKLPRISDHSLELHASSVAELIRVLDLRDVTIVGQDWGGPIAGCAGMLEAHRIRGAVFANTSVLRPARPLRTKPFHRFARAPIISDLAFRLLGFPLSVMHRVQGDARSIGPRERSAYRYPLRRIRDRAGPIALARMVPSFEGHPSLEMLDRLGDWLAAFTGPVGLVWGMRDPILGRALRRHREAFPNAIVEETQAGHFLQEEVPEVLAKAIRAVSA